MPSSFELCTELVRPGGHVANIGAHGPGRHLLDASLLRLVPSRQIDAGRFATHHFGLHDFMETYDVYERAPETGAVKVVSR